MHKINLTLLSCISAFAFTISHAMYERIETQQTWSGRQYCHRKGNGERPCFTTLAEVLQSAQQRGEQTSAPTQQCYRDDNNRLQCYDSVQQFFDVYRRTPITREHCYYQNSGQHLCFSTPQAMYTHAAQTAVFPWLWYNYYSLWRPS